MAWDVVSHEPLDQEAAAPAPDDQWEVESHEPADVRDPRDIALERRQMQPETAGIPVSSAIQEQNKPTLWQRAKEVPYGIGEALKGTEAGVAGAGQITTGIRMLSSTQQGRYFSNELKAMQAIDEGKPLAKPTGPSAAGQTPYAEAYAGATPEQRAQIRQEFVKSAAQASDMKAAAVQSWKEYQAWAEKNNGKTPNLTDINDVKDFGNWMAFNAGQGSVYIVPMMIAALGGPVTLGATSYAMGLGDLAQQRMGETIGQPNLSMGGQQMERGTPSAAPEAERVGADIERGAGTIAGLAVPYAALDVALGPAAGVASGLFKRSVKEMADTGIKAGIKAAGKNIIKEQAEEAIGEGGQQFLQSLQDTILDDVSLMTPENVKSWVNAAAAGAAGATFPSAAHSGFEVAAHAGKGKKEAGIDTGKTPQNVDASADWKTASAVFTPERSGEETVYQAPNGARITPEQWDNASERVRSMWLTPQAGPAVEQIVPRETTDQRPIVAGIRVDEQLEAAPPPEEGPAGIAYPEEVPGAVAQSAAETAPTMEAPTVEEVKAAPAPREEVSSPKLEELERLSASTVDPKVRDELNAKIKTERTRLENASRAEEYMRLAGEATSEPMRKQLTEAALKARGVEKPTKAEQPKRGGIQVKEEPVEHIEAAKPPTEAEIAEHAKWMTDHGLDDTMAEAAARVRHAIELDPQKMAAAQHLPDAEFMKAVEGVLNAHRKSSAAAAGRQGQPAVRRGARNAGISVPAVEGEAAARRAEGAAKAAAGIQTTVRNEQGGGAAEARANAPARQETRPAGPERVRAPGPVEPPVEGKEIPESVPQKLARVSENVQRSFPGKKVKFVAASLQDKDVPPARRQMAKIAQALVEAHGGKVVYYRHVGDKTLRGFSTPDDRNTVYAAVDVDDTVMSVVGHEFGHWLEKNHKDLHDEFTKKIVPTLKRVEQHMDELQASMKRKGRVDTLSKSKLLEEMTSDIWGDFFSDPAFHAELAQANPAVYQRFAQYLVDFIKDVVARVRAMRPLGSDAFIADMEKARKIAAQTLATLKERIETEKSAEAAVERNMRMLDMALPPKYGPPFYSELARGVQAINAKAMTPADWKQRIAAIKGVKKEELEWSGVNDWLDLLGPAKVTKEEVQQFLDKNGVRIGERLLQEPEAPKDYKIERGEFGDDFTITRDPGVGGIGTREADVGDTPHEAALALAERFENRGRAFQEQRQRRGIGMEERQRLDSVAKHWFNEASKLQEFAERLAGQGGANDTHFGDYVLPGGKNYKELLITLPQRMDDLQELERAKKEARVALMNALSAVVKEPVSRANLPSFVNMAVNGSKTGLQYVHDRLGVARGDELIDAAVKAHNAYEEAFERRRDNDFTRGRGSHWDVPNVLAHIRLDERTDSNGKKVLFLEELQSDWAQVGKRQGFATEQNKEEIAAREARKGKLEAQIEELTKRRNDLTYEIMHLEPNNTRLEQIREDRRDVEIERGRLQDELTDVIGEQLAKGRGIPRAPFVGKTESWVALSLKRAIRYAAENGFDRVAWTTGEQQTERYDLSKQVDDVAYDRVTGELIARKGGDVVLAKEVPIGQLDDYIGKEPAAKLRKLSEEQPLGTGEHPSEVSISGQDLKVGGEGMRAFYDKIVPNVANDVLKRLGGGRVGQVDVGLNPAAQRRYEIHLNRDGEWDVVRYDGTARDVLGTFKDKEVAQTSRDLYARRNGDDNVMQQPGFDITDSMRERALEGVAMFKMVGEPDYQSRESDRISPRRPTAVKATEDPMTQSLQPTIAAMATDQKLLQKNVDVLYGEAPDLRDPGGTPLERATAAVKHFVANLLWLHDHFAKEYRDRAKLWYQGGNIIAHRFADRFGMEPKQVAAGIASLSPQKNWHENVSAFERVADTIVNHADETLSAEQLKGLQGRDWWDSGTNPLTPAQRRAITDTSLRQMWAGGATHDAEDLLRMAHWIRAYDELNRPQMTRLATPEGDFVDWMRNNPAKGEEIGAPTKFRWSQFGHVTKALAIMVDGSRENINKMLGEDHKIRSFYNNIIAPESKSGDVTIDTHAFAAAHLLPLGGEAPLVKQGFGGGPTGGLRTGSSSINGVSGNYPIYADAYRIAAEQREILPREMQSITWEAVRGLFRPEQKKQLRDKIASLWNQYKSGDISEAEARKQVVELAGGVEAPDWARSVGGRDAQKWNSTFARELSGAERTGGEARPAELAGGNRGDLAEAGEVPQGAGAERAAEQVNEAVPADQQLAELPPEVRIDYAMLPSTPNGLAQMEPERVLIRTWFDRFDRTLQAEEALAKVTGHGVADAESIRLAEKLFHGRAQEEGEKLEAKYVDPLADQLKAAKKVGLSVRDADDYLMALHAPERNATMKQRDPQGRDGLSGMTDQQAQQVLASFTPAQTTELRAIERTVRGLIDQNLDRLVAAGLVTPATRTALRTQWQHYVPLKTIEEEAALTGTGQGYSMRATDIKMAFGRQSKAGSPIANAIMDSTRGIVRSEKARVEQAIWNMAQRPEMADILSVYDPDNPPASVMGKALDKTTGQWKPVIDPTKLQQQTLNVVINGENRRILVGDETLKNVLVKMGDFDNLPEVINKIGALTRTIGRTLTEWNPSFTVPNAVKDAMAAVIRARGIQGMSAGRVLLGIPKAWGAIVQEKRGITTGVGAGYEEFKRLGGKTGAYGITGAVEVLHDLARTGAELGYPDHEPGNIKKAWRTLTRPVQWVLGGLSAANEVLEYATRLSAFEEAKRAGFTPERAAEIGKEITVNFNRAGEASKLVNAFTVFFNAAMQGVYGSINFATDKNRVIEADSTEGKKVRRAMYVLGAVGFLLQGLNEMAGGDDDDTGELNVNKVSDYSLDKNISVMPGTPWSFKLPISPEYAFAYAVGRRLYRAISQRNYGKEAAGAVGAILDSIMPVRIADATAPSALKAITPTAVLPMAEVLYDENFMGQSFVPHQRPGQAEQPWFTIARSSTSTMAKQASELLNTVTGGDKIQPGGAQTVLRGLASAEGIEHVVGGYTGGLGKTVMQVGNIAKAATGEAEAVDINQTPIAGRFIFTPSKGYTGRRYRELATDFQYAIRRDRANEPISDPAIAAALSLYQDTEKELRGIYPKLRSAEEHEDKDQAKALREQIEVAQKRVIQAYTAAKRASQ